MESHQKGDFAVILTSLSPTEEKNNKERCSVIEDKNKIQTDNLRNSEGMQTLLEAVFPTQNTPEVESKARSSPTLSSAVSISKLLDNSKSEVSPSFDPQIDSLKKRKSLEKIPELPPKKKKSKTDDSTSKLGSYSPDSSNSSIPSPSSTPSPVSFSINSNGNNVGINFPLEEYPPLKLDWLSYPRNSLLLFSQGMKSQEVFAEFLKLPPQIIYTDRRYEVCIRGPPAGCLQFIRPPELSTPSVEIIQDVLNNNTEYFRWIFTFPFSPLANGYKIFITFSHQHQNKILLKSYPIYLYNREVKPSTNYVRTITVEPRQALALGSISNPNTNGRTLIVQSLHALERKIPVVIFDNPQLKKTMIVSWPECFYDENNFIVCKIPETNIPCNSFFNLGLLSVTNFDLLNQVSLLSIFNANSKFHKEFYFTLPSVPISLSSSVDPDQINTRDSQGYTPFLMACVQYNVPQILTFLESGARVELTDPNGWNALHWFCYYGNLELVKIICDIAAQQHSLPILLETPNHLYRTPLFIAAENNRSSIVNFLLNEKNANFLYVDRFQLSPFLITCMNGAIDSFVLFADFLKQKNLLEKYLFAPVLGTSAIHLVAMNGHFEMLKLISNSYSQNLDELDDFGCSPLQWSTKNNFSSITQFLIQSRVQNPSTSRANNSGYEMERGTSNQSVEDLEEEEETAIFEKAIQKLSNESRDSLSASGNFSIKFLTNNSNQEAPKDVSNSSMKPSKKNYSTSCVPSPTTGGILRMKDSSHYSLINPHHASIHLSAMDAIVVSNSVNLASEVKHPLVTKHNPDSCILYWEKRPPERVVNKRQIESFSLLFPNNSIQPESLTWKLELINDTGSVVSHYGSGGPPILHGDLSHQRTAKGILVTFDKVKIYPSSRQKPWKLRCLVLDPKGNEVASSQPVSITICSRKEQIQNFMDERR